MTEDLSARLAQSCPSYFKEDDKIFYEASSLLQRAEAATAAAEKDHLTHQALKLMMKVGRGFLLHANLLRFAHSRSLMMAAATTEHLTRQALQLMMKVGCGSMPHALCAACCASHTARIANRLQADCAVTAIHRQINAMLGELSMAGAGSAFLRPWTNSEAAGTSRVLRRDP